MQARKMQSPVKRENQNNAPNKNAQLYKKFGNDSPVRKKVEDSYLNSGNPIRNENNKYIDYDVSPQKRAE